MQSSAFIICGALGREVLAIVQKYAWRVDVVGISASHHLHPHQIVADVEKQLIDLRARYDRLLVVFGECGTLGALDALLDQYGVERLEGLHCYEWYGGKLFHDLQEEEAGTFFLTDFLVRSFKGSVIKGLGLDRYPELKEEYFRHYARVVYLMQNPNEPLLDRAQEIADYLELPLEVQYTGYGALETALVKWMAQQAQPSITS